MQLKCSIKIKAETFPF